MAQKVRVELVCDLCDDERPAQRTFSFSAEDDEGVRRDYKIELCARHLSQLNTALGPWIEKARDDDSAPKGRRSAGGGRPARRSDGRRPARRDAEQLAGIRAWARAHGYEVSDKGRIPAEIEAAYNHREGSEAGEDSSSDEG